MAIFQLNQLLYGISSTSFNYSELKAGACVMLFYVSQMTRGFDTLARIARRRYALERNYASLSFIVLYIPAPRIAAAIIASSV